MAPRLELFAFRYRDPRTGKWIRARYVAERYEIEARYAKWEVTGPSEVRDVHADARAFSPHRSLATRSHLPVEEPPPSDPPRPEREPGKEPPVKEPPEKDPPVKEPPSEEPTTLEGVARMLLLVFLRRYVTYCASRPAGDDRIVDPSALPRRASEIAARYAEAT